MSLVTFIVPTVGRESLKRALDSIISQTDPDWNAIVIADGHANYKLPVSHSRIFMLNLPVQRCHWSYGGIARNVGLAFDASTWFGFLDDDDRIDEHYVEWLRHEGNGGDLLVFRMKGCDGGVLPPLECKNSEQLGFGIVGISFSVRTGFQQLHSIEFSGDPGEDWRFIECCRKAGGRITISDRIGYYIRH